MQVRIKAKASQDWASRFQDRSRSFLTDRTRRRRTRLLAAADPMTAFCVLQESRGIGMG